MERILPSTFRKDIVPPRFLRSPAFHFYAVAFAPLPVALILVSVMSLARIAHLFFLSLRECAFTEKLPNYSQHLMGRVNRCLHFAEQRGFWRHPPASLG